MDHRNEVKPENGLGCPPAPTGHRITPGGDRESVYISRPLGYKIPPVAAPPARRGAMTVRSGNTMQIFLCGLKKIGL